PRPSSAAPRGSSRTGGARRLAREGGECEPDAPSGRSRWPGALAERRPHRLQLLPQPGAELADRGQALRMRDARGQERGMRDARADEGPAKGLQLRLGETLALLDGQAATRRVLEALEVHLHLLLHAAVDEGADLEVFLHGPVDLAGRARRGQLLDDERVELGVL